MRISESCLCRRLVSVYIVALFSAYEWYLFHAAWGGEQKRAPKNCTPLERGTIEASVNNGFPTWNGKKLQLETLHLDSRLIGL